MNQKINQKIVPILSACFVMAIFGFMLLPNMAEAAVIIRPPNNLNLLGYWSLNDGSGSQAVDTSGNGNHGTLNDAQWTSGIRNGALEFDGTDDYVDFGDVAGVSGATATTFAIWIKLTSAELASDGDIFTKGIHGVNMPLLIWRDDIVGSGDQSGNTNALSAFIYDGTDTKWISSASGTLNDTDWHHITVTFLANDTTGLKIYIDGSLQQSGDTTSVDNIESTATSLLIGESTPVGSSDFDGKMDEVRVYDRVLSASEISNLYNSGTAKFGVTPTGPASGNLVGHWTFDGKDMKQNVADVSGQGNHGDLEGQTATSTVIGQIGQALDFDGVDDYVDLGAPNSLSISGDMTVSAWVLTDSSIQRGYTIIGENYTGMDVNWTLGYEIQTGNTEISFSAYNGSWYHARDTGNIFQVGQWQHVVGVHSGNSLFLYINGIKAAITATLATLPTGDKDNFWIGRRHDNLGVEYWNGSIDDVRVYNKALSVAEILALYNATKGSKQNVTNLGTGTTLTDGLLGHWTFDGKDMYQNVADVSGNGYHGYLGTQATSTVIGKIGQAFDFTGNKTLSFGQSAFDDIEDQGGGGLSISAWVKGTNLAGFERGIMSKSNAANSSNGKWQFRFSGNQKLQFLKSYDSTILNVITNTVLNEDQWYHVAMTWDGGATNTGVKFYTDGLEDTSRSINQSGVGSKVSDATESLYISSSGSRAWNGYLDDIRIYNRVLTVKEIQRLYSMGQ